LIRLHPFFSDFGKDFFSTFDNYPFEIADGYGLYYLIGTLLGELSVDFYVFWVIISMILGYAVYIFLNSIPSQVQGNLLNSLIVFLFVTGYVLPWFSFQNYRYGAALLILGSIDILNKKSILNYFLATIIHSLSVLFLPYYVVVKYQFSKKKTMLFLFIVLGIIIILKDQLLFFSLNLFGYEKYTNDLLSIGERESITLSLIRLGVFLIIGSKIIKKEFVAPFFYLLVIYFIAIMYTPFHGRIAPFIYIIIIKTINQNKPTYKIIFALFLIIEGYFSITKSIFHYGV
jgi:hypothetical protein